MKHLRPLLLALSTLVLLAACSQPEDVQGELETQFGTSGNDTATAVSVASNGVITKAVRFQSQDIESPDRRYYRAKLLIRQLDSSSKFLRQIDVATLECDDAYGCSTPKIETVRTDSLGNVYAVVTYSDVNSEDIPFKNVALYKYSSTGQTLLWKKTSIEFNSSLDGEHLALDGNNNVYVTRTANTAFGQAGLSSFTRYSSNGVKWWQRNSQVGVIQDIDVAGNGDIYIVGNKGVSRYNNGGRLLWTKAIPAAEIETSGSYVYVLEAAASNGDIRLSKRTSSGAQVWSKIVANDNLAYINSLTVDSYGNSYLNGGSPDVEPASIRKFSANGNQVWSQNLQFGGEYVGAWALDTFNGDSIYAVGTTRGPVNGANHGGLDAFIVRLNAQGQKVWER